VPSHEQTSKICRCGVTSAGVNRLRRSGRWISFSGFVLVAMLFLVPFVTVSCAAPGGYGRAAAGATTNYSGVDLAVGGSPSVDGGLRDSRWMVSKSVVSGETVQTALPLRSRNS